MNERLTPLEAARCIGVSKATLTRAAKLRKATKSVFALIAASDAQGGTDGE